VGGLGVLAGVHLWVEVGKQGMVVDKGEEDNKGFLHMPTDIEVCHTWVVVEAVGCGVYCYQSIYLLSETSQVCLGQMAWVLGHPGVPCIGI
jgi:hypothetical protein